MSRKGGAATLAPKIVEEIDEEYQTTLKYFVISKLKKFFVDHIPIDSFKELSPRLMYYFGTLSYAASLSVFIYFVYSSYTSTVNASFISLEKDSGVCKNVPISVSGSYLADKNGNWQGDPAFVFSNARYNLVLSAFEASTTQYREMMSVFYNSLTNFGELQTTQNLADNLAGWMSFIDYYSVDCPTCTSFTETGNLQYMQLTGNPAVVFFLSYYLSTLISASGICPMTSVLDFDQANQVMSTTIDMSTFTSSSLCYGAMNPTSFGYLPTADGDSFILNLDVRSFATAYAVNTNLIQLSALGVANTDTVSNFTIDTVMYQLGFYYDVRYYLMAAIPCIQNLSEIPSNLNYPSTLCFIQYGDVFALPLFNQIGSSISEPSYCLCGHLTPSQNKDCSKFNLMASLLFYDISGYALSIENVIQNSGLTEAFTALNRFPSYSEFNKASYNATFAATTNIYQSSPSSQSAAFIRESFQFCNITMMSAPSGNSTAHLEYATCSILVFNGQSKLNTQVSDYKYTLENGSCVNTIAISSDVYQKLIDTPPVTLVASYYTCKPFKWDALLQSFGIAAGNTSLAVPMCVMLLLPVLYYLLIVLQALPPPEEYDDKEKTQALEILSILLLRMRDGKTRGAKKNGVLLRLTKELIAAAKDEGGYPDSDDEDDEEEEDGHRESRSSVAKSPSKKSSITRLKTPTTTAAAIAAANLQRDSDDEDEAVEEYVRQSIGNNGADGDEYGNSSGIALHNRRSSAGAHRRRSSGARRNNKKTGGGAQKQKMGVFTKQIDERSKVAARKPSDEGVASEGAGGGGTAGGILGYWIGGGGGNSTSSSTTDKDTELKVLRRGTKNPMSYVDKDHADFINVADGIPSGVTILNKPPMPISRDANPICGERADVMVDDLLTIFTSVLSAANQNKSGDDHSKTLTLPSYKQAVALSYKLANLDFEDLRSREDRYIIFIKLSNLINMHASIALNCDMRTISLQYADTVAYNIGGKMLTSGQMVSLC